MRRIAAPSIIASLLVLACSGQGDAGKADEQPGEAKTAPTDAKADPNLPGQPPTVQPPVPETGVGSPTTPVPPPDAAPPVAADDYGSEFCATIIPCYQELEFAGSFMADVTVDIEPDGSVSAVSFTGEAPKPVKSCITDGIKNIVLTAYNGKPGRTRCTKSGQLMGGTQMIMSDRTYEVRDPTASKLEANAEPGDAGKDASKGKLEIKGKGAGGKVEGKAEG